MSTSHTLALLWDVNKYNHKHNNPHKLLQFPSSKCMAVLTCRHTLRTVVAGGSDTVIITSLSTDPCTRDTMFYSLCSLDPWHQRHNITQSQNFRPMPQKVQGYTVCALVQVLLIAFTTLHSHRGYLSQSHQWNCAAPSVSTAQPAISRVRAKGLFPAATAYAQAVPGGPAPHLTCHTYSDQEHSGSCHSA